MELQSADLARNCIEMRGGGIDTFSFVMAKTFERRVMMSKRFYYGMRLRGFSIGTAPTKGIIERFDDVTGKYWNILVYSRELSEAEMQEYELDKLDEKGKKV